MTKTAQALAEALADTQTIEEATRVLDAEPLWLWEEARSRDSWPKVARDLDHERSRHRALPQEVKRKARWVIGTLRVELSELEGAAPVIAICPDVDDAAPKELLAPPPPIEHVEL